MSWLPDDVDPPERVELPTGHHLRPIRADDVDVDYPAVMGSRERLWARYGPAWGWPPATMTHEQDRADLAHHEAEIAARETFNYAILDEGETELLGCVYIDPPEDSSPPGTDAVASWWVVDDAVGSALERALDDFVPRWLRETWGFRAVHWHPDADARPARGSISAVRRAALLWLVVFAAFAATAGLPAAPGRDLSEPEAQSLLVAESIVSDADLDLRDEYGGREWRTFYDRDLVPRAGPRNGRLLDPIGIAFPLLIAPAYALGGATAVQLFLAALAAIGFVLAAALARRVVPEPWATGAALVAGLSPPALVNATTIAPDAVAGSVLAGAVVLALRIRERPRLVLAFWCATLVAALPWLGAKFGAPAIVVALAAARWLRRRQRGLAGLVALEVVIFSVVLYVTVDDNLYGGPFPAALLSNPGATGTSGVGPHLARAPRLLGLWIDRDVGVLRWAPFGALAFAALWLLVRSRRERLAIALSEQIDVEVTAALYVVVCGATVAFAAFLAPTIAGPWFAGHELTCVLPLGGALAAWGLRRFPRTGRALAALTLIASLWVLVAARVHDGAGVAPPRGPLPWGGVERVLPNLR